MGLRLFFLPNFPEATFIPDSRVMTNIWEKAIWIEVLGILLQLHFYQVKMVENCDTAAF